MNPCYICLSHSIILDNIEGTLICTDCGSVQESNLTWNEIHYEHDDYDHYDNSNEEFLDKPQQYQSIPETCWREAQTMFQSLPRKYRGRVKEGVYANCLHQICMLHNIPRSLKEISEILHIDMETMNETSKYAKTKTKKIIESTETMDQENEFSKMLPRYIEKIKSYIILHHDDVSRNKRMNQKKYEIIKQISEWLHSDNLMEGKTPHTKIVTLIYHWFQNKENKKEDIMVIPKKDLCSIFDISIVTLNKSYKQLLHDFSNL